MAGAAGRAWRKAERLCDAAVPVAEAVKQVETSLVWFDADGQLLSRGEAQQQLDKAREKRSGAQWSKVRRLLKDERTLSHVDRLRQQCAEVVAEPQWRMSLTRLWVLRKRLEYAKDAQIGRLSALLAMAQGLCSRLCPQWQEASMQMEEILRQAVRASSAVAGVNRVVRMPQGRHRHGSQGMLDLKRLYGHGRVFREGKRKRRSPDDLLGLPLPISDWWQLLQMDPEELEQQLLTQ